MSKKTIVGFKILFVVFILLVGMAIGQEMQKKIAARLEPDVVVIESSYTEEDIEIAYLDGGQEKYQYLLSNPSSIIVPWLEGLTDVRLDLDDNQVVLSDSNGNDWVLNVTSRP